MGGQLVGSSEPPQKLSFASIFEKVLPFYISIGMSPEQFWDGDVSAHKAYRAAEKLRMNDANQIAWLHGMYFYEALMDAAPAIKAFCKQRAHPYRNEPYDIDAAEKKKREEREAKKRYMNIKDKVAVFAKAFNDKKRTDESVREDENTITPERKEEEIDNG